MNSQTSTSKFQVNGLLLFVGVMVAILVAVMVGCWPM